VRIYSFDPIFGVLTLLAAAYVVFDIRRGGDPTEMMFGWLILSAILVLIDFSMRALRHIKRESADDG
jgi:hypothetical protein